MEELGNVKSQSRSAERRACMTQLIRMTREDQAAVIQENFRSEMSNNRSESPVKPMIINT